MFCYKVETLDMQKRKQPPVEAVFLLCIGVGYSAVIFSSAEFSDTFMPSFTA